jgi:AcrR family transcriptional regulator
VATSRREQAVEERRRRVVRAAAELISERPDGTFSMRELARHSGVSLATPYNLFGSKAAVLGQVFAGQIRGFQESHTARESLSAVSRVETAVEQLVSAFERNPGFFRNLWHALGSLSPTEHKELIVPVSDRLLQPLVSGLVDDGLISDEVAPDTLATTLVRIFDANFEQWASQDWPVGDLRRQLLAGFSLCLLGLVGSAERTGLLQLISNAAAEERDQRPPPGL